MGKQGLSKILCLGAQMWLERVGPGVVSGPSSSGVWVSGPFVHSGGACREPLSVFHVFSQNISTLFCVLQLQGRFCLDKSILLL